MTTLFWFARYHSVLPFILSMLLFIFLMQQFWVGILLHNIEVHHMEDTQNLGHDSNKKTSTDIAASISRNATSFHTSRQSTANEKKTISSTAFLIYHVPPHPGQGTGNLISGLLATHQLSDEFHRIACHVGYESSFDLAFSYQDPQHASICAKILARAPPPNDENTIVQNNYDESAVQSECTLRAMLQDHVQHAILYYKGNTYPRWPTDRNQQGINNYFTTIFQPTPALQRILPWKTTSPPPRVVVHLRDGDNFMDRRQGLDDDTLELLAQESFLSRHYGSVSPDDRIFLVTNRVEWYDRFPEWDHPSWSLVHHSALGRISWTSPNAPTQPHDHSYNRQEGALQMWADWYTLLNAKVIVHTHSDFSLSAARWNQGIDSYTIMGTKVSTTMVGTLKAKEFMELDLRADFEKDVHTNATRRLVDRTIDELRFCDRTKSQEETKDYKRQRLQQTLELVKARRQKNGLDPLPIPKRKDDQSQIQKITKDTNENSEPQHREMQGSFLIYHHVSGDGQGTGNIVSGVLAAHLLAEEFNRTVCHYGLYRYESSMGRAFHWKDDHHTTLCEAALDVAPSPNASNTITQHNYDRSAKQSECELRELLLNHREHPFLYYTGNTYPRWPSAAISPDNNRDYFHEYYQPTPALLEILPWNVSNPPSTVIHLRQGDNRQDQRAGLDDQTLTLLAGYNFSQTAMPLRNDQVFLVTNRVEWYHQFPSWLHPSWDAVPHSSFGAMADWGGSSQQGLPLFDHDGRNQKRQAQEASKLQMWADWYTLVCAEQIVHTHSDFSLSAARWNRNIDSWTLRGSNTKDLLLQRDFGLEEKEDGGFLPPLAERTSSQLKYCA